MKFLSCEKISEHKYKTPEGYLICVDSILARTGKQTYKRSEVFGVDCKDADNEVEIDRTEKEVFSDKTLASFENKPLTVEHPDKDVNIDNHNELAVGFVRDIKRGKVDGQDVMLGTLVITDAKTIEEIENGEHTDLSCGYDCDIIDEDNPQQRNIRGNHVALCQQGRAGIARIVDSATNDNIDNLLKIAEQMKADINFDYPNVKVSYRKIDGLVYLQFDNYPGEKPIDKTLEAKWSQYLERLYKIYMHKTPARNVPWNMYLKDSIKDSWDEDDDALSNEEKELCNYMLNNVYEKGMSSEKLLNKMLSYYSMYQRLARHKPNEVKEYFNEKIRTGYYDSTKKYEWYIRKLRQPANGKYWFEIADRLSDEHIYSVAETEEKAKQLLAEANKLNDSTKDAITTSSVVKALNSVSVNVREKDLSKLRYSDMLALSSSAKSIRNYVGPSSAHYDSIMSILKKYHIPRIASDGREIFDSTKDDASYDWQSAVMKEGLKFDFINGGYGMKFKSQKDYDRAKELAKKYNYSKGHWYDKDLEYFNYSSTAIGYEDSNDGDFKKYLIVLENDYRKNRLDKYLDDSNDFDDAKYILESWRKSGHNVVLVNSQTKQLVNPNKATDALREPTQDELKKFEDYLISKHWHVKKLGKTWTGRIHYEVSKRLQAGYSERALIIELEAAEDISGLDMTYSIGSTGTELKGVVDIDKVYVRDSIKDYQSQKESNDRMEKLPLQARNDMKKASNKKAELLAIKSNIEDIIDAAEPSLKADLRKRGDKIISDLEKMFNLTDSLKTFKLKHKDSKGNIVVDIVKAKSLTDAIKQVKDDRLSL